MSSKKSKPVGTVKNPERLITAKEKRFCEEYIIDFNATRAYLAAGYNGNQSTAQKESWALRRLPRVHAYILDLQKNLEEASGISRMQIVRMHQDIINTSIAHLHKTWITRKEFEKLTEAEKSVIQEIDVKTKTTYEEVDGTEETVRVETEYVRVKLYDRQKSLDALAKILGYNEPDKFTLTADKAAIKSLFPFGE